MSNKQLILTAAIIATASVQATAVRAGEDCNPDWASLCEVNDYPLSIDAHKTIDGPVTAQIGSWLHLLELSPDERWALVGVPCIKEHYWVRRREIWCPEDGGVTPQETWLHRKWLGRGR